ncbi:hypothetical protein B0O99DRAFT_585566 [Bisporella sp. PMI_857]|nr:hypothetical protein B0O99DRAFT_585566 [Bisporella sp. PMI_857]
MISRQEAREIVSRIREDNGWISPEDRAASPPATLRALKNVRRKLGAATKTLATNLYSKDTRFVYELIQNAEDNKYYQAQAAGESLYLSFSIYPDRIVLDSNEDGFVEEDVKAICSVGESTKTAQGYIGEKGIGFKSVFKVSKKVHIQSGPFSFSFEHIRGSRDGELGTGTPLEEGDIESWGDDGLGMVTPIDEEYNDLPEGVRTRITLTLLNPSTFEQRVQDLLNLPHTLLLFLVKLDVLEINIYPEHGHATRIKYSHSGDEVGEYLETIVKTTTFNREVNEKALNFFVVRKNVDNLPPDETRKNTNQATVVLAFPIDEEGDALIEQQHVFAFLPLRLAGFTFIIQSDFITQASREDVFHSARNECLLSHVAETFREAVLKFCDHFSLQYQWMRYLPSDSISDEFWRTLRPKILSLLSATPCLRPWSGAPLCLPGHLYRVPPDFKDRYGEPLFKDSDKQEYLSKFYEFRDIETLRALGVRGRSYSFLVERVQSDLRRADSKMMATTTDGDWHARAANLLLITMRKATKGVVKSLKSLELIPLQDNKWVSGTTSAVFLPNTVNVPIPPDLGINLVQPSAILSTARRNLFLELGVTTADRSDIISRIMLKYVGPFTSVWSPPRPSLENSICHLHYLYFSLSEDHPVTKEIIFLRDQEGRPVSCNGTDSMEYIYFQQEEEQYGAHKLFKPSLTENTKAPGLKVHFLNAAYLKGAPVEVNCYGKSWEQWLSAFAGVKSYPQLLNPKSQEVSNEFNYVMQHRPAKLVGLLERYWSFYEPQMTATIVGKLRDCKVPIDANHPGCVLLATFLPLPRLKSIVRSRKVTDFAFLSMPKELTDEDENKWRFLERFGVKPFSGSDELHFYLRLLKRIAIENRRGCTTDCLDALFATYADIAEKCSSSDDASYIRDYFEKGDYIYIPATASREAEWVNSKACVWTAPEWLESRHRLNGVSNFGNYEHLFRVILKIGDATWGHYIVDLEILEEDGRQDTERVVEIYRRLWREFEHDSNLAKIRNIMEELELVYLPSENSWHPLSSCIWAGDHIRIPGKVAIKSHYSTLEDFFCRVLDVPKPSLEMHVQALKQLARTLPTPSASAIKQSIMLISSMDPTENDVKDLRRSRIFSVRTTSGQISFADSAADFAIVDRSEYGIAFAGKINLLDYSIAEVRACGSLLLALGLKRLHLSILVEETTKVQDGVISTNLTRNFRLKAYALFRCCVHYQSQKSRDKDRSLYNNLLDASIYVSDGIYKSVSVVQYGETVTVENNHANFHLDEKNEKLRLYVPRDENAQEECFFRQLPRRLMTYFAISDPSAEALFNGIIGCRSLIAVDGILKDAGIAEIDGIERASEYDQRHAQPDDEDASANESSEESIDSETSESEPSTPVSTSGAIPEAPYRPGHSPTILTGGFSFGGQSSTSISSLRPPRRPSETVHPLMNDNTQDSGYVSLLQRVIDSAGRMTIPRKGSRSVDTGAAADVSESVFIDRYSDRSRIGAAGELLIFELLLGLSLPGFSEISWESTIRTEVRVHDRYRNLEFLTRRETADITYNDIDGVLTKLFIEKRYLDRETWENSRPKYYLEVKTTTKDCSEQFYMSGSQYNRMRRMKLEPQMAAPEVYVILRVFNLEGRIGLRVYVDPESSRLDGGLEFIVDTWAVKPTDRILI